MEPGNKKILRKIIEMGNSKNITLDVTTNGTIVDEEFHELARQFGHTKWTVSVEGVGKLYDYIRGGEHHPFEELEKNLVSFNQFDRVIIAVTAMTYNIAHLHEIKQWYDSVQKSNYSIYFNNVVATPAYLNPSILPEPILQFAKHRFEAARHAAVQRLKPNVVHVALPKRTLNDEAELDAWLSEIDALIRNKLKSGPVSL